MSLTTHSEQTIQSADGTDLAVYKWTPAATSKPKAQLLIVHGFLEHAQRYAEFAQALAKHQIAVTAFDVRGHGKSGGTRAFVKKWEDYHADLNAVLGTLDKDSGSRFVLGHSNGALICLDYFSNQKSEADNNPHHVKGLLVTSPWLAPAAQLPYIKLLATKVLGNMFPKLVVPVNEKEVSGATLTRDLAKIKDHDEDEANLKAFTVGWGYQALVAQKRVTDTCKHIGLPLFFAYAEKDKVADTATNKRFGQMVEAKDKTIVVRKECYHEILNETNREELYEIIAEWILKRA